MKQVTYWGSADIRNEQIPVDLAPGDCASLIYVFRMNARINSYSCGHRIWLLDSVMGTGVFCVVETEFLYTVAFEDEILPFYINTQSVPRSKHTPSRL